MPLLCSSLLLSLLIASSASAVVTIDWVTILNQANECDPQSNGCFGTVNWGYDISKYEVTNAQYAEFLNAKAASDPLELYSTSMGSGFGGITRSGVSGSFTYSVRAGRGDMPVVYVSFYDALRFANWLYNAQGNGDTETGAYTLLGGTPEPSNRATISRKVGIGIFVTSEGEWYKAAYYDPSSASYFDYPAGSDTQTTCTAPTATPNNANCDDPGGPDGTDADVDNLTIRGSFTGSASPYGTFDQGGNVWEWNDGNAFVDYMRVIRGGGWPDALGVGASNQSFSPALGQTSSFGFRVVRLPEPGRGITVVLAIIGLAGWRRGRA